jgi:four helix bundle protein
MKDFRSLQVWEKSHELTLAVYAVSKNFPKDELFGMTSQIRRATASIPTNIAEGCGRGSDADFSRFLQMAFGSACEVEYHLQLANDLDYIGLETYRKLNEELLSIKRMLASFLSKIKAHR